jgi:plasmid stability protein
MSASVQKVRVPWLERLALLDLSEQRGQSEEETLRDIIRAAIRREVGKDAPLLPKGSPRGYVPGESGEPAEFDEMLWLLCVVEDTMLKIERLTVKLLTDQKHALQLMAQEDGESVAVVVRRIIRAEAERRGLTAPAGVARKAGDTAGGAEAVPDAR